MKEIEELIDAAIRNCPTRNLPRRTGSVSIWTGGEWSMSVELPELGLWPW